MLCTAVGACVVYRRGGALTATVCARQRGQLGRPPPAAGEDSDPAAEAADSLWFASLEPIPGVGARYGTCTESLYSVQYTVTNCGRSTFIALSHTVPVQELYSRCNKYVSLDQPFQSRRIIEYCVFVNQLTR